jgi:hypothetical protein
MTTLETDHPAEAPTAARLVGEILDDAGRLIRQQAAMFRAEVREDVRRTVTAVKYVGAGAALAAVGGLFLAVGLVPLLGWLVPSLPAWACWMIVGGCFLLAGVIAAAVGRSIMKSFNPLPEKTLAALEENVTWITGARS